MKKLLVLCIAVIALVIWANPTFAATKHKRGGKRKPQVTQPSGKAQQ